MTTPDTTSPQPHSDAQSPLELVCPVETLTTMFDLVGTVVDECLVRATTDGLHVSAIGPATVAMIDIELERSAFESYTVAPDGHTIGLDLTRIQNALAVADRDQLVHLQLVSERGLIRLRMDGLEYTIALLDSETIRTPQDIDDFTLDLAATAHVERGTISAAVDAATTLSDHLTLGVDEEQPAFYATTEGDTDEMVMTVPEDDLLELSPNPAESIFSVAYLSELERVLPRESDVQLWLGEEEPVKLRFEIAAGDGTVQYLICPRIRAT